MKKLLLVGTLVSKGEREVVLNAEEMRAWNRSLRLMHLTCLYLPLHGAGAWCLLLAALQVTKDGIPPPVHPFAASSSTQRAAAL